MYFSWGQFLLRFSGFFRLWGLRHDLNPNLGLHLGRLHLGLHLVLHLGLHLRTHLGLHSGLKLRRLHLGLHPRLPDMSLNMNLRLNQRLLRLNLDGSCCNSLLQDNFTIVVQAGRKE